MTTPIENLRNEHRHCSCWGENCSVKRNPQEDWNSHCFKCAVTWPCDTVAALDALEEGLHNLQARILQADALAAVVQLARCGHYWANNAEQRADSLAYLQSRVEELADDADAALGTYLESLKGEGQ